MRAQKPREIVVHHTSYKGRPKLSLERKMRGLESFSRRGGKVGTRAKPAWGDIPYHFYIGATGRIGEGRDPAYAGDTNTPYDVNGRIQVVVEGHFDQEQPRPAQLTALRQLLAWLTAKYAIARTAISAHNDHVSTNCPGKNLKSLLPGISASLPR
ncbi:MAG: peptidoglycan recognition family protein [Pseudomonadota bacterium]